jgi:integrase
MPLESIRTAQVNDWIRSLNAQGLKPKTVHNTYKDFRAILNWHRQELDRPKVCFYAKLPKLSNEPPRWFTPAEVDMLVNAAHGQYKPFFRLAGYSGMRCSELAGLRYEDINFDRGIVEVRRSATYGIEAQTKTPAGRRTVYVDTITLQMIREHLAGRRAGLLFQTKLGTHLKATDINRHVLKPLCEVRHSERDNA